MPIMNIKNYYVLAVVLAVIAGAAAFYFLKPVGVSVPESVKLDEGAIQGLVGKDQTPTPPTGGPKPQPKPKTYTPDEMFDAYSAVNKNLAEGLKAIDSALASGERAFSAMLPVYEDQDHNLFFSADDPSLKTLSEKSRTQTEDFFLGARSSLMAAQSDARANTLSALGNTISFMDSMALTLSRTQLALSRSVLTASITQSRMDGFKNSIGGVLGEVYKEIDSVVAAKRTLEAALANPAYKAYLENYKEAIIN